MKKVIFAFCLLFIAGSGWADIVSVDYLDDIIDSLPTYDVMTAATASSAGTGGLVPTPASGAQGKYLRGDATWADIPTYTAGTGISITDGTITNTLVSQVRSGSSTSTTFSEIWLE